MENILDSTLSSTINLTLTQKLSKRSNPATCYSTKYGVQCRFLTLAQYLEHNSTTDLHYSVIQETQENRNIIVGVLNAEFHMLNQNSIQQDTEY
jgi:hypothetical protein